MGTAVAAGAGGGGEAHRLARHPVVTHQHPALPDGLTGEKQGGDASASLRHLRAFLQTGRELIRDNRLAPRMGAPRRYAGDLDDARKAGREGESGLRQRIDPMPPRESGRKRDSAGMAKSLN